MTSRFAKLSFLVLALSIAALPGLVGQQIKLNALRFSATNGFEGTITGPTGQLYQVTALTNLTSAGFAAGVSVTNIMSTNGTMPFNDPGAKGLGRRFYRVQAAAGSAPVIVTQPLDQITKTGGFVTFTVVATGAAPMSYQWLFNGVALTGATNASLTINNITPANAGPYVVAVSNAAGTARSQTATLTVSEPLLSPSITAQPVGLTVVAGGNATFNVVAIGSAPLSYQWLFNGAAVAKATNASLTLANVQPSSSGPYTVSVSNSVGTALSAPAILAVVSAPTITTQPVSQTVVAGGTAGFSVVATGTAPLSYQWFFKGAGLDGATNATLTISNAQPANAGVYTVSVANAAGLAQSGLAALTVLAPAVAPTITAQPQSVAVASGATAQFSVGAAGTAPLSYQWFFNGAAIAQATSASLSVTNTQAANVGPYTVSVSNFVGAVTSQPALLSLATASLAPDSIAGRTITLVITNGTPPLATNGSFNFVASATTNTYTIVPVSGATPPSSGTYSYAKTGTASAAISFTLTYMGIPLPGVTAVTFLTPTSGSFVNTITITQLMVELTQGGTFTLQ